MRIAVIAAALMLGLSAAVHAAPRHAEDAAAIGRGAVVFDHWCAPCHASGRGHPGTIALRTKYGSEKPAELALRTDLTPEIIHYFLRNGVSVMPFFRKTEVSVKDESDLSAYLTRKHR
jgi:mono/diheme cytochrome c family protein